MIIHVVKQGETIQSIADLYGTTATKIILDNEIPNPDNLVIGECLVILFPEQIYTVQEGDTLAQIANNFGISLKDLLRNNPFLTKRENIYPGEELVISYEDKKIMNISVNGYTYPFIEMSILERALPFLTYLTIFDYIVTRDGTLIDIDDREIIEAAKLYGVAPIMLISTLSISGSYDISISHQILSDEAIQDTLINNTLNILKEKGYYGLTIDFPYISPEDRDSYTLFIRKITQRLHSEGYPVNITLSPSTFEVQSGFIFRGFDYATLGEITDGTIILSYEWGYIYGPSINIMPFNLITQSLDYAVTQIPPDEISFGIPVIGYRWQLPYREGTRAASMSYTSVIELAAQLGTSIQFDQNSYTAFFQYVESNKEYLVRFKDARSIEARLNLVPTYGFGGIGIWNILFYFPQLWLLINAKFGIENVLEPLF